MFFRNLIFPTAENNYKAYLLSGKVLAVYALVLFGVNIFFGGTIGKTSALINEGFVIQMHNQERTQEGLPVLKYNPLLAESARQKGEAMMKADCWSHYCPDGKSPWDFFDNVGYSYTYAGENLAEGFTDVDAMMRAWMNSKTHRENILKSNFTEVGVAVVVGDYQGIRDNKLVVVHFGRPLESNTSLQATAPITANSLNKNGYSAPEILEPFNGQHVNNSKPKVTGKYNKEVNIAFGDNISGRVSPEGGIFTYKPEKTLKDGEYSLKAMDSHNDSIASIPIKLFIDTTPPTVNKEDIYISKTFDGDRSILKLMGNEGISRTDLMLNTNRTIVGSKDINNIWEFDIDVEVISSGFKLFVYDPANNQSVINFSAGEVKGIQYYTDELISDKKYTSMQLAAISARRSFGRTVSGLLRMSTLRIISLLVAVFLCILFVVDFVVISGHDLEFITKKRPRSHFHLGGMVLVVLLILMGNINGVI